MPELLSVLQCTTCMFCPFFSVNAHRFFFHNFICQQVDNLKSNLLEKLEDCLLNFQNEPTQVCMCLYQNITTEQFPFSIVWKLHSLGSALLLLPVLLLSLHTM